MTTSNVTLDQAKAAKAKLHPLLTALEGFNGIGIGKSGEDYTVKVLFVELPVAGLVPEAVDGVPVEVTVTGVIVPLDDLK